MADDAELWGQLIGWALLVGGAIVAFMVAVVIEDAIRVFKLMTKRGKR